MLDLYNKKYSREELKKNIYELKFIDILKTQIIDATFAVRYILNKNYQLHSDDKKIDEEVVLHFQQHISRNELLLAIIDYDSDSDSVENFESVSNK
jgi:hypothetical protein